MKVLLFILSLASASCGGTTHLLSSGMLSHGNAFKVNRYVGCCGCKATYVDIQSGKRTVEQVTFNYNCGSGGAGHPTKFVFQHDAKGRIISGEKYVAAFDDDFSMRVTDDEKKVFQLVDSSGMLSRISGFRKVKANEPHHHFPLIKNGVKLKLN